MKPLHGRTLALTPALFLAVATAASAFTMIDGGTFAFSYSSFPSGPYSGAFHADGELAGIPTDGGTTAVLFDAGGTYYFIVVAGCVDPGGHLDGAVVMIQSPAPFGPGTYPVDAINRTCSFAFADDAISFALPEDPASTDWEVWFQQLVASRKFVGATGAIALVETGPTRVAGTFSGLSLEYGTNAPLAITDGTFDVTGALPVEPASWGRVKAGYRD